MAAIRHSLQRDVFRPNDERLVGFVHVAKANKKKKASFLCVAVSLDKPVKVTVYQVKKSDKDVYKKKMTWPLRELKLLDGKDSEQKETAEFEFVFERPYKWVASSVQEKNAFIGCIWKLWSQHLPRQKLTFCNIPKSVHEEVTQVVEQSVKTPLESLDSSLLETEDYQALSTSEEADLERLMTQSDFVISNAEVFTEQLARELADLDALNIHTIMASEQRVQKLIQIIQEALDEASRLEYRLNAYSELLTNVRESVLQMEQKDALIQIQNKNNQKLLEELNNLVSQLDFPYEHTVTLLNGDLKTSEGISQFVAAAKALQDAMNAQIHPSLVTMTAVQEQKKLFDKLKANLTHRLSHHLNNLFVHLGNEASNENILFSTSQLSLPVHAHCHKALTPYVELMHWLKLADYKSYSELAKVYIGAISKLYDREIKWFFELAKEKISSRATLDKDRKGWSSASSNSIGGQEMSNKPRARCVLVGMDPELFQADMDLAEREAFDKLLERILSVLEPVCLSEQEFCMKFFGLTSDVHSSTSQSSQLSNQPSLLSPAPSHLSLSRASSEEFLATPPKKDKHINEELRLMMGELFSVLEPELKSFIQHYDKVDGFNSMYLLVRFSQHVMTAQDTGSFLSMTFATALVQAKRNLDNFMKAQIRSIEETKVSKKHKCGILPFVQNFEIFAVQSEMIFKGSDRRADLDRWYVKLVKSMFDAILHFEHQKSPQEVILMENFHHLYTLLYQLKISCLENERKEAKQKYSDALQAYVTHYFGRPLEKLNLFFDGVQGKVSQGVKEEEIGYQLAFSKQELRKVIKEYPGKEVKKGLESLCKKVEKHLCEEENLLQVVWHSMQDEFIRQYKAIESLIGRCYPGSMIVLEFSINDILDFFSDIARSH